MAAAVVEHCQKAMQFVIRTNGARSVLEYRQLPGRVLDLYHTEVPPEHQGKGLAKLLVNEAFKYASESGFKVLPTCSYCDKFAREWATVEQKKLVIHDKSAI